MTIPDAPSRVVVMEGRGDLDFALTGKYPVVATGNTYAAGSVPAGQYSGMVPRGIVSIGGSNGPTVEEVAAQRPDLIIMRANGYRKNFHGNAQLLKIAPILPVEVNKPDFITEARRQFRSLGRTSHLYGQVTRYQQLLDRAKKQLGASLIGRRVALLTSQPAGKGYINLWTNQLGTSVAADLGMTVIGHDQSDTDGELHLSMENLRTLADADLIFHQTSEPTAVASNPAWQTLPAVVGGRSAVIDPGLNNGLLMTACAFANRIVEVARDA